MRNTLQFLMDKLYYIVNKQLVNSRKKPIHIHTHVAKNPHIYTNKQSKIDEGGGSEPKYRTRYQTNAHDTMF